MIQRSLSILLIEGVIHKRISSEIVDFFRYFLNPVPPSSLAGLPKKFSKVLFYNTQYEKCLNVKSSLKQIQDAHFHRLFMKRIAQ